MILLLLSLAHAAEWRELFTSEARATSFLRSTWNKYEENYHPNYAFDDDPLTGWVEGADGDGIGEAIEWPITALRSGSELKVQIRAGYHKSAALFAANAAPKDVKLSVLDSRGGVVASRTATLEKELDWQELRLTLPGDRGFNTVRLEILSVYPGTKYKDTVVSDLKTFVLSDVPANTKLEQDRRAALLAWKKERLATAAYFARVPATYPWAGTSWSNSMANVSAEEAEGLLASAVQARKRLGGPGPWYSVARKVNAPLPDGVWLDRAVPGLLRSADFGLFEAPGATGRSEKETDDFDGDIVVTYRRDTSNAHVEWADAAKTLPRFVWFSIKEESWSREASEVEGSFLLEYDSKGQLVRLYDEDRNFDEGGCWERKERLTTFSWAADGKITAIDGIMRTTPESCTDPDRMRGRERGVYREVWTPKG